MDKRTVGRYGYQRASILIPYNEQQKVYWKSKQELGDYSVHDANYTPHCAASQSLEEQKRRKVLKFVFFVIVIKIYCSLC